MSSGRLQGLSRLHVLYALAGLVAALAVASWLLLPSRQGATGTVVVVLASARGEQLSPTTVRVGGDSFTVSGSVPRAPGIATAHRLELPAGVYDVHLPGTELPRAVTVRGHQVEPLLLAVEGGRLDPGGVYAGSQEVNLGLNELGGRYSALGAFHLTDQRGRPLDRASLLGHDTVIAAFHTTCRETCPLYTGLFFQLRKSSPETRLLEITTDPATDTPEVLAAYRQRIGADWTFATGSADAITEFWAPFGVQISGADSHSSVLALVDRHGFLRATYTGTPDVGGRLPGVLDSQLDGAGRQLLAGHGEGWGAPQVLEALQTLAGAAARHEAGGAAPAFTLRDLQGRSVSLAQFRGRTVVLNFWYAGCPPCRQEMPLLQSFADRHPDVALLLLDHRDGAQAARSFASAVGVRAPVLLDHDGRVAAAYRVAGFPTTVVVGPDGIERYRQPGPVALSALEAQVANLRGP